jgi:hypothetical protein
MVASTIVLNKGGGGDRVASDLVDGVDTLSTANSPSTTGVLDLHFVQFMVPLVLAVDTVVNTNTITVESGHGLTTADAGIHIALFNTPTNTFVSMELVTVTGDVILLDSPMNQVYTVGVSTVGAFLNNMNVDGSVTPQVFTVTSRPGLSGNVVAVSIQLRDTIPMDFDTFGGLPVLTNGVVLRINNGDGTYRNLYNFKSNGDVILMAQNHAFTETNGGGVRGFDAHIAFGGHENHDVVVRLIDSLSESMEVVVQDDLTGLTLMDWVIQGSELD